MLTFFLIGVPSVNETEKRIVVHFLICCDIILSIDQMSLPRKGIPICQGSIILED